MAGRLLFGSQSGHTFMELTCAVAIVGVLATSAIVGDTGQRRALLHMEEQRVAAHAASSRLAQLHAGTVDPSPSSFEVAGLPHGVGRQQFEVVEPGLERVKITVLWRPVGASTGTAMAEVTLASLVVTEAR